MALGHVVVLLQHEWPRGENLFLKAINKICQQGNFQYENFFNYVTSILSLTKNVFHILCCSVEKAISFNSSSFPESYLFLFSYHENLLCWAQYIMHCKYASRHLPWPLRVALSTLPLEFSFRKTAAAQAAHASDSSLFITKYRALCTRLLTQKTERYLCCRAEWLGLLFVRCVLWVTCLG